MILQILVFKLAASSNFLGLVNFSGIANATFSIKSTAGSILAVIPLFSNPKYLIASLIVALPYLVSSSFRFFYKHLSEVSLRQ